MNDRRPDPDALLAHVNATDAERRRGRLKIFFGAVAGVGKTFAMLEAGRQAAKEGRDVVVGVVETHGRKETEALLEGLEILPRRQTEHRGVMLTEFDLQAALERKPSLILVDELAHTNAPGSVHEKRWQDIEDLREAGIDVHTTVNVQHLESVNDVVARITHVQVQETVPDSVLEGADEVELIDLPPGDLLKRLKEGKVYVPERVRVARENFFRQGNLIALRQLALRYTAEHVDDAMAVYRRAHAVEETWPVRERLLVGVGPSPSSRRLVRAAKRMAERLEAHWTAVFVETPEYASFSEDDRQRVWETLRLARQLGAETASIAGEGTAALLDYARKHNVSKIVVGKPSHSPWRDRLLGSRLDAVVRASGDIDVYVISGDEDEPPVSRVEHEEPVRLREYAVSVAGVLLLTLVAIALRERVELANLIMLYLAGIVVAAARLGRGPATLSAILSVAAFDWFCVPPYGTFDVHDTRYFPVFAVMLVVGLVISRLTARLRRRAELSRAQEARTAALFAVARELVALEEPVAIDEAVRRHFSETFGARGRILAPDPFGEPRERRGGSASEAADPGVARWVLEHGRPAGPGTGTLAEASALYLPVAAGGARPVAVLEVPTEVTPTLRDPERMQLAETFAAQAGAALERARLAAESRRAEQLVELDRLKTEFVAVAAHELRTPLTSLGVAVEILMERLACDLESDDPKTGAMLRVAHEDVQRLRTLVEDLLDLSRLESRRIELKIAPTPPGALIDEAIEQVRAAGEGGAIIIHEPSPDLPPVRADPPQIARALRNLIDNAARHASPGGRVVVSADSLPDFVQFSVADDGPGIPLADQDRVFEPFFGTEEDGGRAGLGLAIVRRIVLAHGGDVWVDSRPGPGTVFSFTLPQAEER